MRAFIATLAALTLAGLTGPAVLAEEVPETLTIVGQIAVGSPDGDALQAEFDAYAADRDVQIVYDAYWDVADLMARLAGPNPPDLVLVPQPGTLIALAPELVDLSEYVKAQKLRRDYGDYLIDQVTVDDTVVGVPVKANLKSLVWYQPAEFDAAGYAIPETFDELVALSAQMVADGRTPWCGYIGSGPATGWMGTDWIEDLILGTDGPAVYDQWVNHDIIFQDLRVEMAFERYQHMIDTAGYVFERGLMLDLFFFDNAEPLGNGDCLMHKQASFFAGALDAFGHNLDDFATFEFPYIDPTYADAAMGGADYVAAVTDSVEVRQLVKFMASPRFGKVSIAEDTAGWILPNVRFNTNRYSDNLTRADAATIQAAIATDQFRFDGSDLMPPQVGAGTFWTGIVDLVSGAKTIQHVLIDIDTSWPS